MSSKKKPSVQKVSASAEANRVVLLGSEKDELEIKIGIDSLKLTGGQVLALLGFLRGCDHRKISEDLSDGLVNLLRYAACSSEAEEFIMFVDSQMVINVQDLIEFHRDFDKAAK